MRTAAIDARGGARTVGANVGSDGVAIYTTSTGFTVTKTGTGTYLIRFTPPFRVLYGVTATMQAAGAGIITCQSTTRDSFQVNTYNAGAAPSDLGFTFVAAGR